MVLAGYIMQKQKISPSEAITYLKNYGVDVFDPVDFAE